MPKVRGGEQTMAFRKRLGSHIRAARDGAGLTQAALAAAVGVEPQSVSDWETGRTPPSCENLRAITDACNVSSSFLLSERLGRKEGGLEAKAEHLLAVLGSRRVEELLELPAGRLKREIDQITGAYRSGEARTHR